MFRDQYPIAWTFHQNTSRWPFNMQGLPDSPCQEPPFKEYSRVQFSPLPTPELLEASLGDAIAARLSCRRFLDVPLKLAQLATLFKASYGIQGRILFGDQEFLERPVPSGGGLYPMELYMIARAVESIEPGIYHYACLHHGLEQIRALQLPRKFISELFMGQPYVAEASAVVVMCSVIERSLFKYGDRGYRYILFEAGHIAQNLNVIAAALGLASMNIGGFFDTDIANLLAVDIEEEIPLYAVAVGVPSSNDRTKVRQPIGDLIPH